MAAKPQTSPAILPAVSKKLPATICVRVEIREAVDSLIGFKIFSLLSLAGKKREVFSLQACGEMEFGEPKSIGLTPGWFRRTAKFS